MISVLALVIILIFVILLFFAVRSKPLPIMKEKSRILLVIAHPDDETMFFAPTIRSLLQESHRIFVLCISNGNFYGKGPIRMKELIEAAKRLGINAGDVTCLDYDEFEDGASWNRTKLSSVILQHIEVLSADIVLCFDDYGVSGHHNHISCFEALQTAYSNSYMPNNVQIFVLDSIPLWRKYLGLTDAIFSYGQSPFFYVSRFRDVWACWRAMLAHRSQLVWFRYLFIVFSRYVYMNSLRRIAPIKLTPSRRPSKLKNS